MYTKVYTHKHTLTFFFERQHYQKRETDSPSPNDHNGQGWADWKAEARSFSQTSYESAGSCGLGVFSSAFPGTVAGKWFRNG